MLLFDYTTIFLRYSMEFSRKAHRKTTRTRRSPVDFGLRRNTDGVAAIEFAFTVPVLVLILVGLIQVASAFFTLNQMNWVAREAARGLALGDIADAAAAEIFVRSNLINWAAGTSIVNVTIPATAISASISAFRWRTRRCWIRSAI